MTRHLASNKIKSYLTESKTIKLYHPMILCCMVFGLGVANKFTSYSWISYLYTIIVLCGMSYFGIMALTKKRIKPTDDLIILVTSLILQFFWCGGCGWWGLAFIWLILIISIMILINNYYLNTSDEINFKFNFNNRKNKNDKKS